MATLDTPSTQPQSKLTKTNPLAKKLNKILTTSLDDQQIQDALETLAEFYTENTLTARRNLRGDIERRAMVINRRFLDSFNGVNQQLLAVETEIQAIQDRCNEMDSKLRLARDQTSHVMKQTEDLKSRSARCKVRKTIADAFLARFTLSDEEVTVLTSMSAPVGSQFFEALKHLQQINEDCKALLITEHQKAGLEIMESMALYQETAYEKLFRWAQGECRAMNRDFPEVTQPMKEAMGALKRRPVLFQTIIDEISHTRRSALVRSFIDALTRGGPDGYPRPIEMHAHDPLRYVGDMLATLHQAAANDREMLEGLFNVSQESRRANQGRPSRPIPDVMDENDPLRESIIPEEEAIAQILDKNMEGTCRPLRVRIEQVIAAQPPPVIAFKIVNLLQFYGTMIDKVLGSGAELAVTVRDMADAAFESFMDTLRAQAAGLLSSIQIPADDLTPPPAVKEAVAQLKEIMASYDSSLVTTDEKRNIMEILSAMLDPLLEMCVLGAARLSVLDNAIYMVNCLHMIQSALSHYAFTAAYMQLIDSQIEEQEEVLVTEQYQDMLSQAGIASLIESLDVKPPETQLSILPNMDAPSVSRAMANLDTFLCTVSVEVSSSLAKISSSRIAQSVTRRGTKMFIDAYARLYGAVGDPVNGYENPRSVMPRTVAEVETLLAATEEEFLVTLP
ncbi:Golgi transport complex subunit 6 [Rhizophlyctis rosea]|uniref:Conserved oligomeric Golgi complex subunit 6 n=1 Tax=Rhizophlyctis rosea TaxID=64517 RepID=A0AAD5SMK4_9FUNG|nr:Golgi transport complex subunit 6 [Rhizophlyctis rosea]